MGDTIIHRDCTPAAWVSEMPYKNYKEAVCDVLHLWTGDGILTDTEYQFSLQCYNEQAEPISCSRLIWDKRKEQVSV